MNLEKCELTNNIVHKEDGYINATKLCKAGGKLYGHWKSSQKTKTFLQVLSEATCLPIDHLIRSQEGANGARHTWCHPQVAINIAQWISVKFCVFISEVVHEWRDIHIKNDNAYINQLETIEGDNNSTLFENEIVVNLRNELGGELEVETRFGFIDLLTARDVIEVKKFSLWKHALGQILSYGSDFVDKRKRIHLFSVPSDYMDNFKDIVELCGTFDVFVSIEAPDVELEKKIIQNCV
jgi:hypothetical protein